MPSTYFQLVKSGSASSSIVVVLALFTAIWSIKYYNVHRSITGALTYLYNALTYLYNYQTWQLKTLLRSLDQHTCILVITDEHGNDQVKDDVWAGHTTFCFSYLSYFSIVPDGKTFCAMSCIETA